MRGLTLTQPWATLVAVGAKRIETRGWATAYRGPIAIHAGQGLGPVGGRQGLHHQCAVPRFFRALHLSMFRVRQSRDGETWPEYDADLLPRGAIVAVAELVDCVTTLACEDPPLRDGAGNRWPLTDQERAFGDYSAGRYAWLLADVRRLPTPIPCKGALGLWRVPADVEAQIAEVLP